MGEASDPAMPSDPAAFDPWHQDEDLPEPAPGDDTSQDGLEDGQAADAADNASQQEPESDHEGSNEANAISAEASLSELVHPRFNAGVTADGQFDFERVLQDFVLLTFLVSLR